MGILSAVIASRLSEHMDTLLLGDDKQAFVLAFQDTYLIAAILATVATVVSLSYWPGVLRGHSQ